MNEQELFRSLNSGYAKPLTEYLKMLQLEIRDVANYPELDVKSRLALSSLIQEKLIDKVNLINPEKPRINTYV